MPCIFCPHCRKEIQLARSADDVVRLTPRQRQVARMMCDCGTIQDIARKLCVTKRTVKSYLTGLYRKMDVRGAVQLVGEILLPLDSPLRLRVALARARPRHVAKVRGMRLVQGTPGKRRLLSARVPVAMTGGSRQVSRRPSLGRTPVDRPRTARGSLAAAALRR